MRATIAIAPPPSVNETRGEHWGATHKRKARMQRDLHVLLLAARIPRPIPDGYVRAWAVVSYPVRRPRDEGNIRTGLEKPLGDILVQGGWLPDDTPDHFTFGAVTFDVLPGRPAVARMTLEWGSNQ